MAIEKRETKPQRRGLSLPAIVVIGALAVFGAITAVQFALGAVLGVAKFVLIVVVIGAVAAWVVSAKGRR
jgi:hypothetical protein